METITKTIKYKGETYDFTFVNEFVSTKNGFNHHTGLYFEYELINQNTSHYINRTWEEYTYQSCMCAAVKREIDYQLSIYRDHFKREKKYKRLTTRRNEEFVEWLKENSKMNILYELLESLR